MVTGGLLWCSSCDPYVTAVELLASNGSKLCNLPDFPVPLFEHAQSGLITCGGSYSNLDNTQNSCYTFSGGHWKKSHTLGKKRWGYTAWASPQGVLLIGGTSSNTTELLTDDGVTNSSFTLEKGRRYIDMKC